MGYDAEWQVLNSKNFGVPQNRERVFIIGHLRGERRREVFPIREGSKQVTIVQRQQAVSNTLTTRIEATGTGTYVAECEQYEAKVAIPVLTPNREEKRQNGRRFKEDGEPMFTLTAQDRHGVAVKVKEATKQGYAIAEVEDNINLSVPNSKTRRGRVGRGLAQTIDTSCNQATIVQKARGFNKGGEHVVAPTLSSNSWQENNFLNSNMRIRKLTPRECWRLQGFPDWAFDKAQEVNSNSQLYKQAGNSVTVPVIYEIAKRF